MFPFVQKTILFFILLTQTVPLLATPTKTYYVLIQSGTLNIRDKAPDGKVIEKRKKGDSLQILRTTGEDLPYGWAEVQLEGKTGYASLEFLSPYPIKLLDSASAFGKIDPSYEGNVSQFSLIGLKLGENWLGAEVDSPEVHFFLKKAIEQKKEIVIYDRYGNKRTQVQIQKLEKVGCQSYATGSFQTPKVLAKSDKSHIATYGWDIEPIRVVSEIPNDIKQGLIQHAKVVFQKKKIPMKDLATLEPEELVILQTNSRSYAIARFAHIQEVERANVAFVYEIQGGKLAKKIIAEYQELTEEIGAYGGQYHWIGGFSIKEDLYLLYYHIGFDGFIHGLYQINAGGKFKEITTGGGDAC